MDMDKIATSIDTIGKAVDQFPAVEQRVKELESEILRLKTSPMPLDEKAEKKASLEKRIKIVKAMGSRSPETLTKAINETVGTGNGELGGFIPEDWATDIASAIYSYGKIAADAYRIPMAHLTMNYSEYVDGVSANFITTAGTAITSGVPSAVQHTLTARELSALTIYNNSFLADATASGVGAAIVNRVSEDAARQIAYRLQYAILRGDGTVDATNGGITGVLNAASNVVSAAATAGSTFTTALTVANLASMVDAIPYSFDNHKMGWIMHKSLRPVLRGLTGAPGGGYIWSPGDSTNGMVDTIYGYPVYYAENDTMPALANTATGTKFVAFGALDAIKIGERTGIEVATSDQWLFNQIQTAIRWIYRVDAWVLGKLWSVLRTGNG